MIKTVNILNKRARFDYEILETYTAGMVLTGTEIKSLRSSKASITDAFCQFIDGELYIINMMIDEYKLGTFGQFIYDYNCIMDSRKRDFDIILQLGYTSNSIWYFLLPKKPIIITTSVIVLQLIFGFEPKFCIINLIWLFV